MTLAWRLFAITLASAGLLAGGYRWGGSAADGRHAAQQLQTERAANAKYVRQVERGIDAAAQAITDRREMENRYAELDRQHAALRKRVPILAQAAARSNLVVAATPAGAAQPEPADATAQAPGCIALSVAEPFGELTGAAVWLWNSALAGRADVPPDTCGAAGDARATDPSCSASAGLTVDDAWDNHTENAKRSARNAARLERLIRYLKTPSH